MKAKDIFKKVKCGSEDACWPWEGRTGDNGRQALYWMGGKSRTAQRVIYQLVFGAVLTRKHRVIMAPGS